MLLFSRKEIMQMIKRKFKYIIHHELIFDLNVR